MELDFLRFSMTTTQLIRGLDNIKQNQKGGVLTIGNFDGVHLGHQRLISRVVEKAQALKIPSVAITFEPHPYEFFAQGQVTVPRLSKFREKFVALSECGVDNVMILPFNQEVAKISASNFIKEILFASLHPKHIIIGDDFRFGHNRTGDVSLMRTMGNELGFTVEAMDTVRVDGERVSSTRVRHALHEGDHTLVNKLLGHPYFMLGRIMRGDQRGRQWGFPTANIFLHRKQTPVLGVYSVKMYGIAPVGLSGVANVGIRPTVGGTRSLLEVHLFDFNQDIYGKHVRVEFCQKLRDEMQFSSVDLLKAQIAKDVVAARHYFYGEL